MILSDSRILEEIEKGTIKINPYSRDCLGSNSYDVHLGKILATYRELILDAKKHNEIEPFENAACDWADDARVIDDQTRFHAARSHARRPTCVFARIWAKV